MSAWKLANDIEELGFRLDSIKAIISMVAEQDSDNESSSALWGCADMVGVMTERLNILSKDAMELHKNVTPVKAKKK